MRRRRAADDTPTVGPPTGSPAGSPAQPGTGDGHVASVKDETQTQASEPPKSHKPGRLVRGFL